MSADETSLKHCTVGLDIGTTTVKALAFDTSPGVEFSTIGGQPIAKTAADIRTLLQDERAEQDPKLVYAQSVQTLAETVSMAIRMGYQIDRLGISTAMHSVMAISEANEPLTNAMLWMDGRAQNEAVTLWSSAAGPRLYARTGTPIHSMSPLAKLLWLRKHKPDIWQQSARFVSLKEWLWYHWFGVWEVDLSIASSTGLYDLETGSWDEEALHLLGLQPDRLSRLVPTTFTRDAVQEQALISAGLSKDVQCTIGASDGVLANLGVHAIDSRSLVLTIGTSCAIRRGSAVPYTNPNNRPFCAVLDHGRYIIGAASNSGGVVLEWLRHLLSGSGGASATAGEDTYWQHLLLEASRVGSEGLVVLPYVAGERAPLWDADASGLIFGLRLHHRPEHLVRAAVEGILFNAYWAAEDLLVYHSHPERLITTGGVLSEPWIAQLAAQIFQLPVQDSSRSDASACGAALLADIAAGEANWPTVVLPEEPAFVPSSGNNLREEYGRFRQIATQMGADSSQSERL